jgi:lysophospholipase L1-like esterase
MPFIDSEGNIWVGGKVTGTVAQVSKTEPVSPRTIFAIGDSITALDLSDQGVMTSVGIGPRNYLPWAVLYSQGKLIYKGQSGTVGFTTAQVLTTHLPLAVKAAPGICVVLCGTNDVGTVSSTTISTAKANITSIVQQLLAASIQPVLCTIPPQNSVSNSILVQVGQLNHWIKRYGQGHGIPVADFHGVLTDPATGGNYTSGLNTDNLHPTSAGAKLMGQELSSAILTAFPQVTKPVLIDANLDPTYIFGNGLMLTDTNADGLPDNFATSGSPTTSNPTNGSVLGKYMQAVRGAANGTVSSGNIIQASVPGDVLYVAAKVGSTVEATSGFATFSVFNVGTTQKLLELSAWDKDIPDGSVWAAEISMPSGLASYDVYFQVGVSGTASGANARIGQLTGLNLTQAHVLPI